MDKTLMLADGRTLGFAEYGEPLGAPVFLCHGQPGNRYFHPDEAVTRQAGVRLVVPDRPGYGLSTFQAGRNILDWPADLAALADHLEFESFDLIGHSAGGPYALACAYAIPSRLGRIAVISSAPPMTVTALRRQMLLLVRFNYLLTRFAKPLMRVNFRAYWQTARKDPEGFINLMAKQASAVDQQQLNTPAVREMLTAVWEENLRIDSLGYVFDAELLMGDWGFAPEDIGLHITLWWGAQDTNVPAYVMDYYASKLTNCTKRMISDSGHFCLLSAWEQILSGLRV